MRLFLSAVLVLALGPAAFAQQAIVDQFEVRSLTGDGVTLPYRLFVPEGYDGTTAYPLVLALHGAGERGTDNERQIRLHRLATSWADPARQAENPAFVVAPQVPPGLRWSAEQPVDASSLTAVQLTTLAILDSLATEFEIDPDRVYITGLSMGGHGTWDFVSRLPDRFAAAVPMSGRSDPTQADDLLDLPIWAFHGERDTVVPASGSRGMVNALEDLGRPVLYTDCREAPTTAIDYDCPGTIPNAALADAIDAHTDLLFTSVRGGGHGPWTVWYDHPLLADWLFTKHRRDPGALQLTAPTATTTAEGTLDVTWTSAAAATDTVEVWVSVDDGMTWGRAGTGLAGDGAFTLDTAAYPDAVFARVRIAVLDGDGFVYGQDVSTPFVVDNEGNAAPFLAVDDAALRLPPVYTADTVTLDLTARDPEGGDLTATVHYSIDGGTTFAQVASETLASSAEPQAVTIDVASLANALDAQFRVDLSDGVNATSAATALFDKRTPRQTNPTIDHVTGDGLGTLRMHFIEPENLTGHRYAITIDDSDRTAKTYSVRDLDRDVTVVAGVPLSDGVRESPLFDGMRLIVQDLDDRGPNLDETGWISGDTDLSVTISGGNALLALRAIPMLATETTYLLTMADTVVDTSEALFAVPAQPLYFTVTGEDDGAQRAVLFNDRNDDGRPALSDILHILEEDADGALAPAWEFRFSSSSSTTLPEAGDTFRFVPLRSLSAEDRFEFTAAVGVAVDETPTPDDGIALSSYPNPFTDVVSVAYTLPQPARVSLVAFDLLGRRVATLTDAPQPAGAHRVTWDADAGPTGRLPSGLYLLRLSIDGADRPVHRWQAVTLVR